MSIRKLAYLVIPVGFGLGVWLSSVFGFGDVGVVEAHVQHCVTPMEAGQSPNFDGLRAFNAPNSGDNIQKAAILPQGMGIYETRTKVEGFVGCIVQEFDVGPDVTEKRIAEFDTWADEAVLSGKYVDFQNCFDPGLAYYRVVEFVEERPNENLLVVYLAIAEQVQAYTLKVAESDTLLRDCTEEGNA